MTACIVLGLTSASDNQAPHVAAWLKTAAAGTIPAPHFTLAVEPVAAN
jgi:hypothetical protein